MVLLIQESPTTKVASSTKKSNGAISGSKKTLQKTRKFVVDGVVVTYTTVRPLEDDRLQDQVLRWVEFTDCEEICDHVPIKMALLTVLNLWCKFSHRKQELRELKCLQKQENKSFQDLAFKAQFAREQQEKRFEQEIASYLKQYDSDLEALNRQQKQRVEKAEQQQELDYKYTSKKIRQEQEKELKEFREALKNEAKLLKQEIDLLPKDKRKEIWRVRKEKLDAEQAERERQFIEKLNETHDITMKRLTESHKEKIALLERTFLQQKQQLLRSKEATIWELEERHMHERHALAKKQLKDIFFLQRHQMMTRHEKVRSLSIK